MDFALRGKLAVITGGANGIGLAAASLLAEHGASVAIFDLPRENPEAAARAIGARGFAADVTDRASLDAAFAAAGPPDIVIANAGVASETDLVEQSVEEWNRILTINLTGAFHTVQASARLMKPRRAGAIVLT